MFKNALRIVLFPLVAMLLLASCSVTDNRNLSGGAARDALNQVIQNSIDAFEDDGGSETTQISTGQYATIYNPQGAEGQKVVNADLSDKESPTFGDETSIALLSMKKLLAAPELQKSNIELSNNTFTIKGSTFIMTVRVRNDHVVTTTLEGSSTGLESKQVIMTTYGLTEEAMAIYEAAK